MRSTYLFAGVNMTITTDWNCALMTCLVARCAWSSIKRTKVALEDCVSSECTFRRAENSPPRQHLRGHLRTLGQHISCIEHRIQIRAHHFVSQDRTECVSSGCRLSFELRSPLRQHLHGHRHKPGQHISCRFCRRLRLGSH